MDNIEFLRKANIWLRYINIIISIILTIIFWANASHVEEHGLFVLYGFLALIGGIGYTCIIFCLAEAFLDLVENSFYIRENTSSKK